MKSSRYVWSAAVALWAASTGVVWCQSTAQSSPDRLIIAFKDGVSAQAQDRIAALSGLSVLDRVPELGFVLAQAAPGRGPKALAALKGRPEVERAGEDIVRKWIEAEPVSFQGTPLPDMRGVFERVGRMPAARAQSPVEGAEAGEVQWGVQRVNAPAAWPVNQGANVKVAVIDTGIDPNHPELKVAGGANFVEKDAPWADDHFHGTHVAGVIAAAMDGRGVVGVSPKATLYAIKVLTKEGSGNLFAIIQGVMWCAQNGIKVANMSLGAPQEIPFLDKAINFATSAGVTIVAAAGNDAGAVNCPACYEETIAISALCPPGITNTKLCPTTAEGIATFSSRGPQVDFIAPGVLIPSTVPLSHDASGVKAYSGTSMATPHMAGLAALAVAKGAATPAAVRAALTAAAAKLPNLGASEQGNGIVDASKLERGRTGIGGWRLGPRPLGP